MQQLEKREKQIELSKAKLQRRIQLELVELSAPEEETYTPLRRRIFQPFDLDWLDFITVVVGVIFIIFALFGFVSPPAFGALFFGIALLITTAVHQRVYQVGVLAFTVMYWLSTIIFGVVIDALDISLFIFGINTISLGVFLVGSIAVATAGLMGFIEGVYKTYRWAGVIILIFSIVLGLVDFFFAVYGFLYPIVDAFIVVLVNMGVYAISLSITYIIFYYFARFYGIVKHQFESIYNEEVENE